MELFDAITARASYRGKYTDHPVPREDLERIVDAGIRAPSGYNGQSTSFVIVTDPELRAQVAELAGTSDVLTTAPAIIVVVMDPTATADREFNFGVEDYAASTENMLLAITALGYASVWIDGALRRNDVAGHIARLLDVPERMEVRVILPVGAPAEPLSHRAKRPFAERAWFERFGA
jgi:nitroreductase